MICCRLSAYQRSAAAGRLIKDLLPEAGLSMPVHQRSAAVCRFINTGRRIYGARIPDLPIRIRAPFLPQEDDN